jgi:GNAT superfamily N-acetyltransferase
MLNYYIVPFIAQQHAIPMFELVRKTILESYAKIYNKGIIHFFLNYHSAENQLKRAFTGQTFVAIQRDRLIGTANVCNGYFNALFVDPKLQSKGTGRALLNILAVAIEYGEEIPYYKMILKL